LKESGDVSRRSEPSNKHAAPTELEKDPEGTAGYRHGAPTELPQKLQENEHDSGKPVSDESTKAIPTELQALVDDVSAAARRKPSRSPNTDSAAADVREHRAPYSERGSVARAASDDSGDSDDSTAAQPINPSIQKSKNPPLPDLILIDGGRGQLNAACAELEKLGLSRIPILGLAKEFEEIYRPGEKEPLRLSEESGALKLLQRVRDESHRLANTYNATLRLRKISESILDEFPNIGERRKAALLKKFGSIQRMRLATVEQLAEVPGFGGKAAAELKAFLEARST
jgi:excinuclease ABC subunit C